MNPADLSLPSISPTLTSKNLPSGLGSVHKSGKAPIPRIDVEPIYTQIKGALGSHWQAYKAAINAFILGNLNQTELAWVLQPLFSNLPTIITPTSSASLIQLHNQLVICLYSNILRDPPASEVAPWVVATDKPTTIKNSGAAGASDKAEERLKREVMAIHARDRRRIKTLKAGHTEPEGGLKEMKDYKLELTQSEANTGASWDVESRRRYLLPLGSETLEFPSQSDMQSRIEAMSLDEGLIAPAQGITQACAEILEQAAETLVKTMISELQLPVRSNGNGCIQTAKFKRQYRKEESEAERGIIQKSSIGLLPVELEAQAKREPLAESSLFMALELGDSFVSSRFLAEKTRLNQWPTFDKPSESWSAPARPAMLDDDAMMIDDEPAWYGVSQMEQNNLLSVLDDCLAVG